MAPMHFYISEGTKDVSKKDTAQSIKLVEFETPIQSKTELLEAHAALARYLDTKYQISLKTRQEIQQLQEQAAAQIAPLNTAIEVQASRIHQYMTAHRATLIPKATMKSTGTPTGRIGWREAAARIEIKIEEAEAIKVLREQLPPEVIQELIVIKESIDKKMLNKYWHLVKHLKGFERIKGDDVFYISMADTKLEVQPSDSPQRITVKE